MFKRFLIVFLLTATSAQAQTDTSGRLQDLKDILKQISTSAPVPAGKLAPAAPGKTASLDFKPSAQLRQQIIKAYVDGMRGPFPEVAKVLEASFKDRDVFAEANKQAHQLFGVSVNNVADALAVFLTYGWLVARGDSSDPTKAQVQAVSKQFKGLATKMANMSELQKQQTADAFTMQSVIISFFTEVYSGKPDELKKFGQGQNESLKRLGFDLNAVKLTDQGFIPAK